MTVNPEFWRLSSGNPLIRRSSSSSVCRRWGLPAPRLHLIKEPIGQGKYRYAVSVQRNRLNVADKLRTIFRESIISVDYAQNIVVIKTMAGSANAAAAALDSMSIPYMVGSLAGDDTAMLVMRDTESARSFCDEIHEMLK